MDGMCFIVDLLVTSAAVHTMISTGSKVLGEIRPFYGQPQPKRIVATQRRSRPVLPFDSGRYCRYGFHLWVRQVYEPC